MSEALPDLPDLAELRRAYATTRAFTEVTPLLRASGLAERTGAAAVWVKAESLQRAGSFKVRGALWRLVTLTEDHRRRGVVAYSSGNFAQGLAAAGRAEGVPVTIVMPEDAPAAKRRATEGYGARVVLSRHGDRPREEVASALAREIAAAGGLTLLHPFDDPVIVAGQAGAGLEALDQLAGRAEGVDDVLVCTGGGGLVGGVALAFHHLSPETRIHAVEPEGFNGMGASLAAGRVTRVATGARTICDALQATAPGAAAFAAARLAGARGATVPDRARLRLRRHFRARSTCAAAGCSCTPPAATSRSRTSCAMSRRDRGGRSAPAVSSCRAARRS
jgi:threonine dehydratase